MGRHSSSRVPAITVWRGLLLLGLLCTLIATAVGLVALWPQTSVKEHTSPDFSSTYSLNHPHVEATVDSVDSLLCSAKETGTAFEEPPLIPAGQKPEDCKRALITITSGMNAGKHTQLVHHGLAGDPHLQPGDAITLSETTQPDSSVVYAFADYQRGSALKWWAAAVVIIIVAFAAWQGLRAIVGLFISLGMIFAFLLPAITEGSSPLGVTLTCCSAILLLVVPIVHGVNWKAAAALGGSLLTLAIAAWITAQGVSTLHLQGLSSEDNLKLALYFPAIPIVGVLLCGFIVGALGGLNDVAIAQASTVNELFEASPHARPLTVFLSAMKVGRDHISSMVYTLVLTYVGTTLPLIIFMTAAAQPMGRVISSDLVTTELMRSGMGAITLTLAVPLTTAIACFVVPHARPRP